MGNRTDTPLGQTHPDQEFAGYFRSVLRHAVYFMRDQDVEGGLTSTQLSMLNMVAEEPLRVGVIARNAGVRVPSATEQIIRLEKAGLLQRAADPRDSRAVLVHLTDKGARHAREENRRRNDVVARRLAGLSSTERDRLAAALPILERLVGPDATDRQEAGASSDHNDRDHGRDK